MGLKDRASHWKGDFFGTWCKMDFLVWVWLKMQVGSGELFWIGTGFWLALDLE